MRKCILLALSLCINLTYFSIASSQEIELDKIVVTPYRTQEEAAYNVTNTETVTDASIESRNEITLGESLDLLNGIDVVGAGRFASASQGLFIRGAQPRHTAYMLEGIKLYDPSNPSSYYVPSDVLTVGIQKIEVVKVPLSSLYGSSPMAGVVNLFNKKPQAKPYVYLELEQGMYETRRESIEFGGKVKDVSYLFGASRLDTEGYSKAREKNNNPEDDPYQNTNFNCNLNYVPQDGLELGLFARALHSRTDNDDDDDYDGLPEDDTDNFSRNNELVSSLYAKKKIAEALDYKIQLGLTSFYRRYYDDNDGHVSTDNYVRAWYKGKTYQALNSIEWTPSDFYTAVMGFDYTREKCDGYRYDYSYAWLMGFVSDLPRETTNTKGYFVENIFEPLDVLRLDFSFRYEQQPLFKDHSVIQGGVNYKIPWLLTELYASYHEGFKAPSLYQLYDPGRGNTQLKPEESESWVVGFAVSDGKRLQLKVDYFHSDFSKLIDFVYTNPAAWTGEFLNTAKAKSRGVEVELTYKFNPQFKLATGYTYLTGKQDFVDEDSVTIFNHRLIRVPKQKIFALLSYTGNKIDVFFDLLYAGKRYDRIWQSVGFVSFDNFVEMKDYYLANLSMNYRLSDNTTLFLKVNNLFNQDYERIKGFQEEKTAVYAGLKLKF